MVFRDAGYLALRLAMGSATVALAAAALHNRAAAQTFDVVHRFDGTHDSSVMGALMEADGALYGTTQRDYEPPACTPLFGDVPCPSLFAAWIQQLYEKGMTAGCAGGAP